MLKKKKKKKSEIHANTAEPDHFQASNLEVLCANTAKYTALSNLRSKSKYFTNTLPLQGVPMFSSIDYRNRKKKIP